MADSASIDSDVELDSIADGTISDIDSLYENRVISGHDTLNHSSAAAAQAAKAIEAAQDIADISRGSLEAPSLLTPASSSGNHGWAQPVWDAGPAPPDYLSATTFRQLEAFSVEEPALMLDPAESSYRSLAGIILRKFLGSRRQRKRRLASTALAIFWILFAVIFLVRRITRPAWQWLPREFQSSPAHRNMDARCELSSYHDYIDIPFENPKSFSFIEDVGDVNCGANFTACTLGGYFMVTDVSATGTDYLPKELPMLVRISIATAWPFKMERINYDKTDDSLVLKKPSLAYQPERSLYGVRGWGSVTSWMAPCLDVRVRIFVRRDVELTNWGTRLRHFAMEGASGEDDESADHPTYWDPSFRVTNWTHIQNHHGSINSLPWRSRNTRIETRTSKISGPYALEDNLHLESWGGKIIARVNVEESVMRTAAGVQRNLTTIARSGDTILSFWEDAVPPHVSSSHVTSSGKIALKFPSSWNGTIHGMSVYGDIRIRGTGPEEDIRPNSASAQLSITIPEDMSLTEETSRVQFSTERGDVDIMIGNGLDWTEKHMPYGY